MTLLERGWARAILWVCFIAPLGARAYLGQFSRYMADDYCTAQVAQREGVIGSVAWWYNNWAGQYTNWTMKGIASLIGPGFATILPTLIIGLWLIMLMWMLYELSLTVGLAWNRYAIMLLSTVIIFATIDGFPNAIQSLYWIGANIPYTTPLIFLIFLVAFCTRVFRSYSGRQSLFPAWIVTVLVTFVAGGLSEVYTVFQVTLLTLCVWVLLFRAPEGIKGIALKLLAVALFSTLIALIIVVFAPGNAVRQAFFTHTESLPELVAQTVVVSAGYIVLALGVFAPLPLLITVVVSGLIAYQIRPVHVQPSPKRLYALMGLSAGIALLLIMSCLLPALYGLGNIPSSRAYTIPQFVLVCTAAFWGYLMGLGLRSRQTHAPTTSRKSLVYVAALAALLVVGPLASTGRTLTLLPDFQTYASEWDARDRAIREAVGQGIERFETTVFTFDLGAMAGLDIITSNPAGWVNGCAASYYGLESIIAEPLYRMGDKT